MKNWILGTLFAFLAFGYTAYSGDLDLFGLGWLEVGNVEAICPRCETTYTINICENCGAESEFEIIGLLGMAFKCTNCDELYGTYRCEDDGTNINRFRIVSGNNTPAAEPIREETILTLEDFTPEMIVESLKLDGKGNFYGLKEIKISRDTIAEVRAQTRTGTPLSIVGGGERKILLFITAFWLKKEFDRELKNHIFTMLCDVIFGYGHLKFTDDNVISFAHIIPMDPSGITISHFYHSLGGYIEDVEKIEEIGKRDDIFE